MIREKFNTISISEAITHITALGHQALAGGGVDSEKTALQNLIQKLTSKMISPEEALLEAEKIISQRQDYH